VSTGGGVLGERQPARVSRERCKLPQRDPAAKRFSCILHAPDGLSWNFLGAKFAGGRGPLGPACLSPPIHLLNTPSAQHTGTNIHEHIKQQIDTSLTEHRTIK